MIERWAVVIGWLQLDGLMSSPRNEAVFKLTAVKLHFMQQRKTAEQLRL